MWNSSDLSLSMTDNNNNNSNNNNTSSLTTFSEQPSTETQHNNASFTESCIKVVFSQMEFLPWDNPDNIVSAEVETIARRIKNNLLVVLFLIGGPANVINMAVFAKQGLSDRVNLCLFALALADEVYLVMAMLLHGEQLLLQFTSQQVFGRMMIFLTNNNVLVFTGSNFVSLILSAIVATERCLCVFNPLKFQSLFRTRTVAVLIISVYVVVLGLFLIVTYRYRIGCVYDPESGLMVTTAAEGEFYRAHKAFVDHLESFVFGVGLPGVTLVIVVITTVLTVVKLRQVVKWRSEASSLISPREVALTKMLVGNSILFIVCTSPNAINRFSWIFFPEINSGRRNHNLFLTGLWITELFAYCGSTFNVFVFYSMGTRYRETLWTLFGRRTLQEKPQ